MPIQHAVWTVSATPAELPQGMLPSEQMLEDMIVAETRILSSEWMLIGRQVETGHGGRIDLLAIAPDGTLVLVELKRDRTPREVVAQALDYAAWIEAPVDAIDYVITHELCHVAEPHHGAAFFDLLEMMMPDWERRKQRLEQAMA